MPISSLSFKKVKFYTIRFNGKDLSEFREFLIRLNEDKTNQKELSEINRYIENIGERFGALPHHFRSEGAADALPPPYHQFIETESAADYGIRLYCIRLSPSIVILLNGGRKTSLKVQDCKNCYPHFERARKVALLINKLILEGFFTIDEETRKVEVEQDVELSI